VGEGVVSVWGCSAHRTHFLHCITAFSPPRTFLGAFLGAFLGPCATHTHTPFTLHQMPRCVCVCVCVACL
jgi:hypothetical protein